MIPYARQEITRGDIKAVAEVLQSNFISQGPKIPEFEKVFASYVGSKYAVAVSSGTAALHLAALSLGVNKNTHVLSTPLTFVASLNCILYCGDTVDFADIDPLTQGLSLESAENLLLNSSKKFHGLVIVDYAGFPVNMEKWRKLATQYNLWIIEDACHALGGYFTDSKGKKQKCGNGVYADIGVFSFQPLKHITTGEGGMITTNRKDIYEKLLLLRTHGITKDPKKMKENHGGWYYEMQELGYNYRLTDFASALGLSQLSRADMNLKKRKSIAAKYNKAFKNTKNITCPTTSKGHAYHLYVIQAEKRLELFNYLRAKDIFVQVHYIPVYRQPYYKKMGFESKNFSITEKFYEKCLSLPMYPSLKKSEQDYVIKCIKSFYRE